MRSTLGALYQSFLLAAAYLQNHFFQWWYLICGHSSYKNNLVVLINLQLI